MSATESLFGIYDGELSPDFCRAVVERFEADPRKVKGMVGGGAGAYAIT